MDTLEDVRRNICEQMKSGVVLLHNERKGLVVAVGAIRRYGRWYYSHETLKLAKVNGKTVIKGPTHPIKSLKDISLIQYGPEREALAVRRPVITGGGFPTLIQFHPGDEKNTDIDLGASRLTSARTGEFPEVLSQLVLLLSVVISPGGRLAGGWKPVQLPDRNNALNWTPDTRVVPEDGPLAVSSLDF